MNMRFEWWSLKYLGSLVLGAWCFSHVACAATNAGVQISQLPDRLRVEINGALFIEYHFATNLAQPFYYPFIGPGGAAMTRDWPMKDTPGEEHDHPHHRSLWFAHGEVNGVDFWTEGQGKGRIVHAGFDEIKSGNDAGIIKSRDNWTASDGKIICTDERTFRIHNRTGGERLIDFEITLHAVNGELKLGDTKEGTMAVRIAETMRLKKFVPKGQKPIPGDGHIVLRTGLRDAEAWGKRAAWCDYHGPVNGKTVGIAIFDHPQNPRHPTWWMVRDYGLFAANPFGQHEYEKTADPNAGDLTIPAGKSVTFRYRFLLHAGDEQQGRVAERYAEFVGDDVRSLKSNRP